MPSSCALCGCSGSSILCDGCRTQFFSHRQCRCKQCGVPLAGNAETCGACLAKAPPFDATIVATDYAPPVDRLVLALKFGARLELAPLFARMMHDAVLSADQATSPSLLIAVPLGPRRLVERGFNQALEIARPLARSLAMKLDGRLATRHRDTDAQALLPPGERHKNMRNAFAVTENALPRIRDQHVAVVDDVMTTGETLDALASTLKRAGAARVTNIVFARTPQK